MNSELIEARAIVDQLAAIRDQLKPGDLRFLESWESYLLNAGDQAAIGKWRIHNLRQVAGSYGILSPTSAPVENLSVAAA